MRLALTADIHGYLPSIELEVPECDVLVIAGDVCPVWDHDHRMQAIWLRTDFARWLEDIPARVVGIAGNHDFVAEENPGLMHDLPWTYLMDEGVMIDDVTFWGTPWSVQFGSWAFMDRDRWLADRYSDIGYVDVLVTHGPPYGAGDVVRYPGPDGDNHVGSRSLRDVILRKNIPLVVTGHIHEDAGEHKLNGSRVVNASYVDLSYTPGNPITVVEVEA